MKISKPMLITIIAVIAVTISVIIVVVSRQEKLSGRSMTITINGKKFTAVLYDNKTADELYSRLPLELDMNEMNGNEKYYDLSESLTTDSRLAGHISKGDIKLYGDNCLVLFYDSFSSGYSYTDIGYIKNTDGLEDALGNGNVTVRFSDSSDSKTDISESSSTESQTVTVTTTETSSTTTTAAQTTAEAVTSTTISTTETTSQTTASEPPAQSEEVTATETVSEEELTMIMEIAGTQVAVEWEDNASVEALKELCKDGELTVQMSMYGGFEQVGSIGTSLPRGDVQMTTNPGDIVLYSGDRIVVFYGSNSWSYTKLGHITDSSGRSMEELLGNGDVSITIRTE